MANIAAQNLVSDIDDINENLISTADAASMFRKKIAKNTPPYTKTIQEANNKLVNRWKKEVLDNLADTNGKIQCSKVAETWSTFNESQTIRSYIKLRDQGMMPRATQEQLDFWLEFFTLDIETMHSYGTGTVSFGWILVQNEMRMMFADEKWEHIYSKSENAYECEKIARDYPELMKGTKLPFGWDAETFRDIQEKVRTILMVQPTPDN